MLIEMPFDSPAEAEDRLRDIFLGTEVQMLDLEMWIEEEEEREQ